jgi:uncharacterized protein YecT (DUF1311 family)
MVIGTLVVAQGHIDHIKDYEPLRTLSIDCNDHAGDNRSERICANLAFQRSDSILVMVYEDILTRAKTHYIDDLSNRVIQLQTTWRLFRDQHCEIVYAGYEGCGGCHQRHIDHLYCLTELTKDRIVQLEKLRDEVIGR